MSSVAAWVLVVLLCAALVVGALRWMRRASPTPEVSRGPAPPTHTRLATDELEELAAHAVHLTALLDRIGTDLEPGTSTVEIDARIESAIVALGLVPAMKGYNGFPAASAVSMNEEILHGLPSSARTLASGDLVTLQAAVRGPRVYAALGRTYPVGAVGDRARALLTATDAALDAAIGEARAGRRVGDLGSAIQSTIEAAGLYVVRDYVGYGMGRALMHEPALPGVGRASTGMRLREGMVLHLHVIAKEGSSKASVDDDRWTVRGAPGELSALATAMVRVGGDRAWVLTPRR